MRTRDELGRRGKVGVGGACAACCVVPMLVLAGLASIGTLLTFGVAAASVTADVVVALGVGRVGWPMHHRGFVECYPRSVAPLPYVAFSTLATVPDNTPPYAARIRLLERDDEQTAISEWDTG